MRPQYATSRAGIVHLIGRIDSSSRVRLEVTWKCGGSSRDATLIKGRVSPEELCDTCASGPFGEAMVYRCYTADGQLLYIGSAVNWQSREWLHRNKSPWWPEVARVEKSLSADLRKARYAERKAIKAEAPLHNKQHNSKRFRWTKAGYVPIAQAA